MAGLEMNDRKRFKIRRLIWANRNKITFVKEQGKVSDQFFTAQVKVFEWIKHKDCWVGIRLAFTDFQQGSWLGRRLEQLDRKPEVAVDSSHKRANSAGGTLADSAVLGSSGLDLPGSLSLANILSIAAAQVGFPQVLAVWISPCGREIYNYTALKGRRNSSLLSSILVVIVK